ARQLVNHGHFLLNNHKADIASMQVKIGDVITLKEKSRKIPLVLEAKAKRETAPWLLSNKEFTFELTRLPERKEVNTEIKELLIVEYYNK
ncbi:MAG: S4 domain-containing protein, partial [Metamycoplasmataceae bacterium]